MDNEERRREFNRGYVIACCNIYNLHGDEVTACDVLAESGIMARDVKMLDLSDYDLKALAVIRKARSHDPLTGKKVKR